MEKVRVIVDTSSDITVEQAAERGIDLLPVGMRHGGKFYREAYDITKREFWELLEQSGEIATTSQVLPQLVEEAFERALADGCTGAVLITICGDASGLYQSAHVLRELFYEEHGTAMPIEIINSHTFSYLYGRPVMLAGELAQQGASLTEVVSFLKDKLSHVYGYAPMFTIRYSQKSGRISSTVAFVGEMMGVKPILYLGDNVADVCAKVRGEAAMLPKMLELVKQKAVDLEKQEIMLITGLIDPEYRENLIKRVQEELNPASIFLDEVGCSIANNCGPKIYGVLFYGPDNGLFS